MLLKSLFSHGYKVLEKQRTRKEGREGEGGREERKGKERKEEKRREEKRKEKEIEPTNIASQHPCEVRKNY